MKKMFSLLLIFALVFTLFTACSKEKTPDKDTVASPSPSANVPNDGGDGDDEPDELIELEFWGVKWNDFNSDSDTTKRVQDAINAITEEEIGVHVNFTWVGFADYSTQLTLAIANNERVDLASYYYRANISTVMASGSAMDITDLLQEHATETLDMLGWIMNMTTFGGRIYGVPNYRQLNANQYAIFRVDNLEAAGVYDLAKNMTTWSEFEQVIAAVTDTGTYGLGQSGGVEMLWYGRNLITSDNISDTIVREYLGDSMGIIAVDENDNVISAFDHELAAEGYKMIADWYNKGYVYPEAPYSTETNKTLLGMNVFGSLMSGSEFGVEFNYKATTGTDCLCVKLWANPNSGSAAASIGAFVPVTSGDPEAAVKLINLIWNSAELCNLISWGLEGETYIVENGVAKYPDGMDAASSGYHNNDYSFANQFLMLPWDGASADFRELALEDMNNAPVSKYAGFAIDLSDIPSEVAALSTIKSEYLLTLGNGMYTEKLYNEFLEKLEAAGLDTYLELFQSQLDEFMK